MCNQQLVITIILLPYLGLALSTPCCDVVELKSTGQIASGWPLTLGNYTRFQSPGIPEYRKGDGQHSLVLPNDKSIGWKIEKAFQGPQVKSKGRKDCPEDVLAWQYPKNHKGSVVWKTDTTARFVCVPFKCCRRVRLQSTGGIAQNLPQTLGEYTFQESPGIPEYIKGDDEHSLILPDDNTVGWRFSKAYQSVQVKARGRRVCPEDVNNWFYASSTGGSVIPGWAYDKTAKVICVKCCEKLKLDSTGEVAKHFQRLLGVYTSDKSSGMPVYQKGDGQPVPILSNDKSVGWKFSIASQGIEVRAIGLKECPEDVTTWQFPVFDGNSIKWKTDSTVKVVCN